MPINASNAITVAHQVRTYTLEAAGFTDSMDVLYVARMMERFMEYVRQLREVRFFFFNSILEVVCAYRFELFSFFPHYTTCLVV